MSNYTIQEFKTIDEMLGGLNLIRQLYPKMTDRIYRERLEQMIPNNYGQVIVLDQGNLIGLSGYWINTRLYCGKYIDIDNVIIDQAYRSKGIGKLLMDHLQQKGKSMGCRFSVLDAYVENFGAHRFYFREGFTVRGFHFLKRL